MATLLISVYYCETIRSSGHVNLFKINMIRVQTVHSGCCDLTHLQLLRPLPFAVLYLRYRTENGSGNYDDFIFYFDWLEIYNKMGPEGQSDHSKCVRLDVLASLACMRVNT